MSNVDSNEEKFYALAGTFTKFLIENFGIDKYIEVYKGLSREKTADENIKLFEGVYGKLKEVEKGG